MKEKQPKEICRVHSANIFSHFETIKNDKPKFRNKDEEPFTEMLSNTVDNKVVTKALLARSNSLKISMFVKNSTSIFLSIMKKPGKMSSKIAVGESNEIFGTRPYDFWAISP